MYNFLNANVSIYHGHIFATDKYGSISRFSFPSSAIFNHYLVNVSIVNFMAWKGERLKSHVLGRRNRTEINGSLMTLSSMLLR